MGHTYTYTYTQYVHPHTYTHIHTTEMDFTKTLMALILLKWLVVSHIHLDFN